MKQVKKRDVEQVKLLISKGLSNLEICDITGWSTATVERIKAGKFDTMLEPAKAVVDIGKLKDLMQNNLETLIKIDGVLASLKKEG